MEFDLETGHRSGCDGGGPRPRGGSNVGGGRDGRRAPYINSSSGSDGDGRTARRTNRSDDGGGGGRRARHINRWREQDWTIVLAIHGVYLGSNGLLYILIQIKYQNLNSPFETHMVMTSSLVALCVYFCAATLQTILVQNNKELDDQGLLNHLLVSSGILSAVSNMLVFLPNMVGWIVVVVFVFGTTILLAYDVFKLISNCISERNGSNNHNVTPTSESVGLEMSIGINDNAAATSESLEISIENNNETSRNNSDAVEMLTGNNFTGSTHTPFHSF